MSSSFFQQKRLEDVANILDAKRKPVKASDRKAGPYPYYGASGITDYVDDFIFDGDYVLLAEDGDNIRTKNTPIAFMAKGQFWVNNHAHILQGKDGNDTDFICYALQIADVDSFISGSTRPKITQADMKRIQIFAPSPSEQKAIASILGTLDDKIELNRQMNETLEAMAQALFKSWFVDFDPVIDNALAAGNEIPEPLQKRAAARQALGDQRKPLPADIQSLFPDRFVFIDEMGWVPDGWSKKTLGDFDLVIESGKRPKGGIDKSLQEGIPSVGAESLLGTGQFDYSKVKYVREDFAEQSKKGWVNDYDVGIYKDGANVGDPTRVSLFGNRFPFDRFMVNEHVFLLRSKLFGQPFLYWLLKSDQISYQLLSMGTSKAAQPGLNQKEVLSCSFLAPSNEVFEAFNSSVLPLINHQLVTGSENQTLGELRDTLLPELLSGELRIPDAEKQVAEAV